MTNGAPAAGQAAAAATKFREENCQMQLILCWCRRARALQNLGCSERLHVFSGQSIRLHHIKYANSIELDHVRRHGHTFGEARKLKSTQST